MIGNELKIKIQKAELSDIDELTRLSRMLWDFEGRLDSHYSVSENFEIMFKGQLRRNLGRRDAAIFKAVHKGKIVGQISGEVQEKVPYRKLSKVGYMEYLFVAKPYRGKGVATCLVEELLRWFRKKGLRHAEVIAISRNMRANHFYRKLGFREIHRKYMLPLR